MYSPKDEQYMLKALGLAERGLGSVAPNPMVGCVIVHQGRIVGRGWHREFGGPHAEVDALQSAGDQARGGTMYVTLEPCNHYGKTPPCTDAILDSGIRRVVIGMPDPNPDVRGGGADRLEQAGLLVVRDVLREACEDLNEVYLANVQRQRPFIMLKIAQTLDGFIAPAKGVARWITSEESRTEVHRLRARYDAVLIGANTVRKDNPQLTVRHIEGPQPYRVVLARNLAFPPKMALFSDEFRERTIIVASHKSCKAQPDEIRKIERAGVTVLPVTTAAGERASMSSAVQKLYEQLNIRSILVEGGAEVFSAFLGAGMTDRIDLFTAPKIIGEGMPAFSGLKARHMSDAVQFSVRAVMEMGGDTYTVLRQKDG
jgi:diaminohydroxyphosphoribosylaminopyrimidine deaminase/5-amino-6-(5-phosphoribosylamino)uracil reductase